MADIGEQLAEVNSAVQVLLRTGMSTLGLRKASELGVNPARAREVMWPCYAVILGWMLVPWRSGPPHFSLVAFTGLCELSLFARLFVWRPEADDEAFITITFAKLWGAVFVFGSILRKAGYRDQELNWSAIFFLDLAVLLSLRGRLGVMELPFVGRQLARTLEPTSWQVQAPRVIVGLCLLLLAEVGTYHIFGGPPPVPPDD